MTMRSKLMGIAAASWISMAFVPFAAFASGVVQVDLDHGSGSVEFHATGHPSALKIVGKGPAPRGNFTVDGARVNGTARFDLASLDTGIDLRNKHMKDKYLEVGKYPEATLTVFQLTLPKPLASDASLAHVPFSGKLLLHGVERPVSGSADIDRRGNVVSINAQFGLKIADYKISEPKFAGISMADDIEIVVRSTAPASLGGTTRK